VDWCLFMAVVCDGHWKQWAHSLHLLLAGVWLLLSWKLA
jgi:hypothetical protein